MAMVSPGPRPLRPPPSSSPPPPSFLQKISLPLPTLTHTQLNHQHYSCISPKACVSYPSYPPLDRVLTTPPPATTSTPTCTHSTPDVHQAPFWLMTGAFRFMISTIVLLVHTIQRWRFDGGRGGGWNPTHRFINIIYLFHLLDGPLFMFYGTWRLLVLDDPAGPAMIVAGVAMAAPYLLALCYGRDKLFKVMARRFEKDRRGIDSALIAELMDDTARRCGTDWWIHHGKCLVDDYPDPLDHRRNWTRAVIFKIESDRFAIDTSAEQLRLDATRTNDGDGGGGANGSFFGGRVGTFFGRERGSSIVSRVLTRKLPKKVSPASLTWISLPSSEHGAESLLESAQSKLRTLDGQYVTRGLLIR